MEVTMGSEAAAGKERLYVGVDVGGTKILAALVAESGVILSSERCRTPGSGAKGGGSKKAKSQRNGSRKVLAAIVEAVEEVLSGAGVDGESLTAIALAVPGVVDPDAGRVVVTPNMALSGVEIVDELSGRLPAPLALGNDCNLGTLGERWLGSGRGAASLVGILVGTGIGGGFVQAERMWRGARESALEIGHMIMEIGGPECGCGNRGCFEALAGRLAIERDIRAASAEGRETVLAEALSRPRGSIRSGALRKALEAGDELVAEVLSRAAEVVGTACINVRHVLDPERIVLGGGVMEACGDFMLPVVRKVVAADKLPGARAGGDVRLSALGDDAVVLGAVAHARAMAGRSPFDEKFAASPRYARVSLPADGRLAVGDDAWDRDVYVNVAGKSKKRKKSLTNGEPHEIGPAELEKVCRGGPEVLFVGTGDSGAVALSPAAAAYLEDRGIECRLLPTREAVEAYNASRRRRAGLFHVGC
jgi:glucokinase